MAENNDPRRLHAICCRITEGRILARQLAFAVREYQLSETEFRLLWLLGASEENMIEQRLLATRLGISPAQVSAVVEKMRTENNLEPVINREDRRRQFWQLTARGNKQIQTLFAAVGIAAREWKLPDLPPDCPTSFRLEDAA